VGADQLAAAAAPADEPPPEIDPTERRARNRNQVPVNATPQTGKPKPSCNQVPDLQRGETMTFSYLSAVAATYLASLCCAISVAMRFSASVRSTLPSRNGFQYLTTILYRSAAGPSAYTRSATDR
jgi:hypothetical protein